MELSQYHPRSVMVTKSTLVDSPRFPVIDSHNHLGEEYGGGWIDQPVNELLAVLDRAGVWGYVDLDGGWGEEILLKHLARLKTRSPERFRVFGGVNWSVWQEKGDNFPRWAAERMRAQAEMGANGLKIWKLFGLKVRDHNDKLVAVDDPRLDPIWETASELGWPVTIHIADPVAFFDPLDEHNERWEELHAFPDWHFPSPPFPPFLDILNGLARLVERHPRTTFIGAHVGCYAEDLGWVGALLERCPNFMVDISARLAELGRQPYTARKFFLKYADRILFGLDSGPDIDNYRVAYRFLETDDEYFCYAADGNPMQGRWNIYGIYLPDDVLKKIYYQNACRVFGFKLPEGLL